MSSHLVDLIDVTLACEDANLKLVEVVTVAEVDDDDRVGKLNQFFFFQRRKPFYSFK